jgi:ActR/RegA family two-component response regulator
MNDPCLAVPALCPLLYVVSLVFGGMSLFAQANQPSSSGSTVQFSTTAAAIMAAVALVGAIGAQIDAYRKRSHQWRMIEKKMMEVDSSQQEMSRKQDVQGKGIQSLRKNQIRIEESVKGLESMRDVWGTKTLEGKKCLLLVDDDPATIRAYTNFARVNLDDPCIVHALSIDEAMIQVRKLPIWILLDMKVGDRSGLELIPYAKSYNTNVKIVIITGTHDPSSISAAVAMGVEVLGKPPDPEKLEGLIKRMRRDFGIPPKSSESIPVVGTSGILPGISRDETLA